MPRQYRSSLTMLQAGRRNTLPVLMEDDTLAPPVPPKDPEYVPDMDSDHSASKRKREARDGSPPDDGEMELRTPKRNRSRMKHSDDNATPAQQHSIRRKQGIRDLSNLSLKHAVEPQPLAHSSRESKFQEGSLSDKPSEAPPSVYTRVIRTDSGDLVLMDDLMADYHNAGQTEHENGDDLRDVEVVTPNTNTDTAAASENHGAGFFRFGRSLATSFHPVTLWNRIWNEQKEELTRQHILEAERRAKQKSDAEARYAEMKQSGQFEFQPVSTAVAPEEATSTPYDSAVSLESAAPSQNHRRISSLDSHLLGNRAGAGGNDEAQAPDTASKALRSIRSRLYLKRPSLSNLKNDLKRVRSDLTIGGAVQRDSSSSASPVKADFEHSTLRRSHSKYDLKKQQRLSKRVSDLELKLNKARRELEDVLAEASPAPKLGGKYERFTPTPTLKRPKFIPGRLPTLPSERILFPELADAVTHANDDGEKMDLDDDNEETIKASRERQYPTRAAALFQLEDEPSQPTSIHPLENSNKSNIPPKYDSQQVEGSEMDPNSTSPTENITVNAKNVVYSDLDRKLKALDQSYKASRKTTTSKKRKSGGSRDDAAFRMGADDDDDDAEWEEANQTPKKKRKSGPNKSKNVQETSDDSTYTAIKQPKVKKVNKTEEQSPVSEPQSRTENASKVTGDATEDDTVRSTQFRNSLDLQAHQLEPLYEEEEEVMTVPLKDEPSKPTAKATPARYGRPRLLSPRPQSPFVEACSEEVIIHRAAGTSQKGRQGRAASPPPGEHSQVMEVIDEVVTATPGEGDVPVLPTNSARGQSERDGAQGGDPVKKAGVGKSMVRSESFQWPDDVF